ncbi:MAG: hypothetical protein ACTSWQ_03435 [Candidatus Thorarchaeota archaeon]
MVLTNKETALISKIITSNNALIHSNIGKSLLKSSTLENLITSGIVQQQLQAHINCTSCKGQMEDRFGTTLVCMKCGHQIDLNTKEGVQFTVYRVSPENLALKISNSLSEAGFETCYLPDLRIAGVQSISRIQIDESSTCELVLVFKPFDKTTLYALLGAASVDKSNIVVLHSDFDSTTNPEEVDTFSFPRLLPFHIANFSQESFVEVLKNYITLTSFLSSIIYSIKDIVNSDQKFVLTRTELDFLDNAKTQSKIGGIDFEPIALRLLQVFSFTSRFESGGYGPDGMLWLPEEFYIVDAKSTKSNFEFAVSERDKIHRYMRTIEEKVELLDGYHFSGEIIITPDLREPYTDTLDKVEKYFVKNDVKGRLVVMSSDGLINLYQNALSNLEFFNRLRPNIHVSELLRGSTKSEDRYTKVVYISRAVLEKFEADVLESPALSMRTISDLKDWVESQFKL